MDTLSATENSSANPPRVVRHLRMTGENLAFSLNTTSSNEIRADRMTADNVVVGASAAGGVNFEMSYQEFDPFLEAVLQGTWTGPGNNGVATITVAGAINHDPSALAFTKLISSGRTHRTPPLPRDGVPTPCYKA